MKPQIALLAALTCFPFSAASGGDPDFGDLVRRLEAELGVEATRVPMMGVSNVFLRFAGPAGAGGLKLAVFESTGPADAVRALRFQEFVRENLGERWRPFVRVYSRAGGEAVSIYFRAHKSRVRLLMAALEDNEATLIQMDLDPKRLARWLLHPERAGDCMKYNAGESAEDACETI